MPKLQITLRDGGEHSHDLVEDLITIGRVEDNAIQIDDASVSSHHAQLACVDGDYMLKDIGSTNGTRLNGNQVEPDQDLRLQDGDKIRFGNIEALYGSDVPSEARPMPEQKELAALAAESSIRPADFSNASPFEVKKQKKDPASTGIMVFAIVALLAFGGAVASIMTMQSPL